MKKCPTCGKTFDDSMRFCQVDGTPLESDEPTFDPYATIVAPSGGVTPPPDEPAADSAAGDAVEDPAVNIEIEEAATPAESEAAIDEPHEVLDLPDQADPLRTMYVSDQEMKEAMGESSDSGELELPPEPPKFNEPEIPSPPMGEPDQPAREEAVETPQFESTNPPIPSPFDSPSTPEPKPEPEVQVADEPETVIQPEPPQFEKPHEEPSAMPSGSPAPPPSPFQVEEAAAPSAPPFAEPESPAPAPMDAPAPEAEWTPPPAPVAAWENQEIGQNTPFQPPADGTSGQNKTLPIISLVLGVISLCCYVSPVTGLAALITGFLGMKNANNDPNTYGGKGLAIAGMITGGIFFLIGVAYYIFVILVYAGMIAGSALPNF